MVLPTGEIGIVQEFLPGDDLTNFPRTAPTPETYLKALYQLAAGLDDIHAHRLIHRDFKCNNVKYDQEGLLRISTSG